MKLAYWLVAGLVILAYMTVSAALTAETTAGAAVAIIVGGSWLLLGGAALLATRLQKHLEAK